MSKCDRMFVNLESEDVASIQDKISLLVLGLEDVSRHDNFFHLRKSKNVSSNLQADWKNNSYLWNIGGTLVSQLHCDFTHCYDSQDDRIKMKRWSFFFNHLSLLFSLSLLYVCLMYHIRLLLIAYCAAEVDRPKVYCRSHCIHPLDGT